MSNFNEGPKTLGEKIFSAVMAVLVFFMLFALLSSLQAKGQECREECEHNCKPKFMEGRVVFGICFDKETPEGMTCRCPGEPKHNPPLIERIEINLPEAPAEVDRKPQQGHRRVGDQVGAGLAALATMR